MGEKKNRYPALDLDKEYYFEMKREGKRDVDVCNRLGISPPRLYEWKNDNLTPEERKFSNIQKNKPVKKEVQDRNSTVTTWKMSPEELAAYLEKHPIKPKPKQSVYDINFKRAQQ